MKAMIRPLTRRAASPLGSTRLFFGLLGLAGAVASVMTLPRFTLVPAAISAVTLVLREVSWLRSAFILAWLAGRFDVVFDRPLAFVSCAEMVVTSLACLAWRAFT